MRFLVKRTSDWFGENIKEIEIQTLEELLEMQESEMNPIIIHKNCAEGKWTLEIYDAYRE